MKIIRLSLVLALVWIAAVAPVSAHTGAVAIAEPTSEELLKELNGEVGIYKTYDDFVHNKPMKLTFVEWNYFALSGNVEYVKANVKDENGAKSMLLADEVWGIRLADGLYRGFTFDGQKPLFYRLQHIVDPNEKSTAKAYMEWQVVNLEYEGKFILKFVQGRRVFTTSVNGAKEPAKTKGDVRNCAYAARAIGNWQKTLAAYQKCDGLQYVLDEDYGGKDMVPYFKKNPDAYKKYMAIQTK